MTEIRVPDIGDFSEVDVIEVLVGRGDRIRPDDGLLTLETDKASMDVPSPMAGVVEEVRVTVGDKVSKGDVVVVLESDLGDDDAQEAGDLSADASTPAVHRSDRNPLPDTDSKMSVGFESLAKSLPPAPPVAESIDSGPYQSAHASPALRRFARELGVDLALVQGTGRKGRITREDVQDFVKRSLAQAARPSQSGRGADPIPEQDFTKFGKVEEQSLSRIRKISGAHLHRCWLNVPMVTFDEEADITEMEAFRQSLKGEAERRRVRLTGLAFITKALGAALQAFPMFNASLSADGERLIVKKYYNIGIWVDTPDGLVVPVLKGVESKGVFEIAGEMGALSRKAKDGKLSPADMAGGCMTISSLGGIGGVGFTPLVNAPEVAILGLTRGRLKPLWNGSEFVPRLMQPLHVTFDHRVIDGAAAARFATYLRRLLGDVKHLVL